jgi:hypothetical protein
MGWIAGEEVDVCDSFTEEGMSRFEAGRRDGEKARESLEHGSRRGGTARGRNGNDSKIRRRRETLEEARLTNR